MSILDDIKKKNENGNADQNNAKSMENSKVSNPLDAKTPPPPLDKQDRPLVTQTDSGASVVDTRNPKPESGMKQDGKKTMTTDRLAPIQGRGIDHLPKKDEVLYSCPHAEGFSMHLSTGEVRAVQGLMKVTQDQSDEIQALIRSGRPDIAQNAILLDPVAAEEIAREWMLRHKAEAGRGASNAENANFREIREQPDRIPGQAPQQANAQGGRADNVLYNGTKVIEEGAFHADDAKLTPDGQNADNIQR